MRSRGVEVLPPFGDGAAGVIEAEEQAFIRLSETSGTFRLWKRSVAEPAVGSSYVSFAIMHALAAPLYKFATLPEGAVFNISAPSSVGKTTALKSGASVSGNPETLLNWNTTLRGLQERAAAHSDLQLILDDTETIKPHEANALQTLSRITHMLPSGTSTGYAESVQAALLPLQWTCWAISTSPWRIDPAFEAAGRPRSDSDRVRLIDIPVPNATEGGICDRKPSNDLPTAERSEKLVRACQANYGFPLREWLEYVVNHQEEIRVKVQKRIEHFVAMFSPDASNVERRVARKFGLVYAAGRIATDQGLLPWDESHALKVAGKLFRRSRDASSGAHFQIDAILRRFVQVKVGKLPAYTEGTTPIFATDKALNGFVLRASGADHLYIRSAVLERLCRTELRSIKMRLKQMGALVSGEGGKCAKQPRVKVAGTMRKPRMLVIDLKRLRAETRIIKTG